MSAVERRNELSDYDVSYCVYGSFRECDGDEGYRDTRWLHLEELIAAFEWDFLEQYITSYEETFITFRRQSFEMLREQHSQFAADMTTEPANTTEPPPAASGLNVGATANEM